MHRAPILRPRFLGLAITTVAVYFGCPFQLGVVQGDSMFPTLKDGAICVLDRNFYRSNPMRKGDIIVFEIGPETLTKRVYGAPGDTITLIEYLEDGTYSVPDPRSIPNIRNSDRLKDTMRLVNLRVPPGKCFVLGDNAAASEDSRFFGLIDTSDVVGKMMASVGGKHGMRRPAGKD